MLYAEIPADFVWQIWQNNASTNGDQDLGHPGPPIPYEDRLGAAKDLPLLKWRAEGYDYQGIAAAHQERTNASLREATLDIEAREKADTKRVRKQEENGRKPKQENYDQHGHRRGGVWTEDIFSTEGKLR